MEFDAVVNIATAAAGVVALLASPGARAVLTAIFRNPKKDSIVVHTADGDIKTYDLREFVAKAAEKAAAQSLADPKGARNDSGAENS